MHTEDFCFVYKDVPDWPPIVFDPYVIHKAECLILSLLLHCFVQLWVVCCTLREGHRLRMSKKWVLGERKWEELGDKFIIRSLTCGRVGRCRLHVSGCSRFITHNYMLAVALQPRCFTQNYTAGEPVQPSSVAFVTPSLKFFWWLKFYAYF